MNVVRRLVSLALLIAAWYVGAQLAGPRLLPDPQAVALAIVDEARSGALAFNLGATLRAGRRSSFAIAMALGTVIGLVDGPLRARRPARRSLAGRAAQPAGAGDHRARLCLGRAHRNRGDRGGGAQQAADRDRDGARGRALARPPGSTRWRRSSAWAPWARMRHVVLPQLAPYLAAAARSGLSLVWKIVLIVELLGRPNGVGFEIGVAFQLFDVTRILAYALAFIAVMLVIETFLVQPLERHVSRWRPRTGLTSASSRNPIAPPRAERCRCSASLRSALRQRRGRRAGRPVGLRQDHAAADHRRARPRLRGQRRAARPRHGSAWCSRSRACCPGARSSRTCGSPPRRRPTPSLDALFRTLGLAGHRDHYPGELSLGLARRVALARAFAVEPDLLLLDEPFVSLDDALAARLRDELAELVNRRPVTTLLVTHDVEEAIGLADRLFLLSASPARVRCRGAGRAPAREAHARKSAPRSASEIAQQAQSGAVIASGAITPAGAARRIMPRCGS